MTMQIIEWRQFIENGLPLKEKLSSVTIGVFDGVHRGHQALIKRVVSHNAAYTPVVITFRENHKGGEKTGNIQSFQEKLEIFEQLGVKITLIVDFTEDFRRMKGIEFLEILLKHGNIGFFTVGKSFRCGHQLDTDAAAIREFFAARSVQIEIVDEVMEGSQPISSSRIRAAIADGDHQLAQAMLGR
jgi:riboflavin kinase/FMN adenylyltransferase